MKKIIILLFLFMAVSAKADVCDDLYNNLPDSIKEKIATLSWIDVNSKGAQDKCRFVIRYYPCNTSIQEQLNETLPDSITDASTNCSFVSQGKHKHTEGYCTLENVVAQCES